MENEEEVKETLKKGIWDLSSYEKNSTSLFCN